MNILILGDVMGLSGRKALKENLPEIIKKNQIDFSIINGENAADDGKGITKEIAEVEKLKEPEGALIASVSEKSPADKAGLQPGDIILKFDGKKIDTMRTLPKLVSRTEVGKTVDLEVWRDKKLITKKLTLGRLETSEDFKAENKSVAPKKESEVDILKITVREISTEDIESRKLDKNTKGVVILNILDNSPLAGLLQPNDIILEVQKKSVANSKQLNNEIESLSKKGEKTILLTIINSNNQRRYLGVKLN